MDQFFFPADISGEMSGFVTRILKGPFRDGAGIAEGLVRKFAHGIEYAALGTAMAVYAYEALARRLSLIGLLGLLTAVIDETIQIFRRGAPRRSRMSGLISEGSRRASCWFF